MPSLLHLGFIFDLYPVYVTFKSLYECSDGRSADAALHTTKEMITMQRRLGRERMFSAVLLSLSILSLPAVSHAQFPGGGPPPPGLPGGGPPPGFRGGPGREDNSLVNVPVAALAAGLNLTDKQKTQISEIQDQVHQQIRDMMPAPGSGPPDFEAMRSNFSKIQNLNKQGQKRIEAVLTSDQKKAVPGVLKGIQTLRAAGIPLELMGDLKLTADQQQKLASITRSSQEDLRQKMQDARQNGDFRGMRDIIQQSRQEMHTKVMAALTDEQRTMVENYLKEHPQRGPGAGFGPPNGGFGPPPGGFGPPPGGGGPPSGGDGPPPGNPGDAPPPPDQP